MDLFVTLNVATFEKILYIPIVCKYFIFVVHGEKKISHVAIFEVKSTKNHFLEMLEIIK
jgi:hypothetical protein